MAPSELALFFNTACTALLDEKPPLSTTVCNIVFNSGVSYCVPSVHAAIASHAIAPVKARASNSVAFVGATALSISLK